jgi:hypothetical protein
MNALNKNTSDIRAEITRPPHTIFALVASRVRLLVKGSNASGNHTLCLWSIERFGIDTARRDLSIRSSIDRLYREEETHHGSEK